MSWRDVYSLSAEELFEKAKRFSVTATQRQTGPLLVLGDGATLFNEKAKPYIDFISKIGQGNVGHNHKEIEYTSRTFFAERRANLLVNSNVTFEGTKLQEVLCKITPGDFDKKVLFMRSGREAVESAMKICIEKNMNKWPDFFAFKNSFHGRGFGALLAHDSKEIHRRGFVSDDKRFHFLEFPMLGHDCEHYKRFYFHPDQMAYRLSTPELKALFFEVVQGEGGMNVACDKCLPMIVKAFQKVGLAVDDEIQTGFGRTGTMFACEQYGIVPDIMCLGKALNSEMNLGAVVVRADLDYEERGRDGGTGPNALTCAVALTGIEILQNIDKTELKRKIDRLSTVAPEGLGMMRRFQCKSSEEASAIRKAAEELGLLVMETGVSGLRLMPPLIITDEELNNGLKLFTQAVKKVRGA